MDAQGWARGRHWHRCWQQAGGSQVPSWGVCTGVGQGPPELLCHVPCSSGQGPPGLESGGGSRPGQSLKSTAAPRPRGCEARGREGCGQQSGRPPCCRAAGPVPQRGAETVQPSRGATPTSQQPQEGQQTWTQGQGTTETLTPVRPDNGRGAADAASALIFPKLKSAARRLRLRPPRFSAV